MPMQDFELIVVGAGVAGLTAAMVAARHGVKVGVVDRIGVGGQIATAERIDNFPGFPQGIGGHELGPLLHEQAEAAGAEFLLDTIEGLEIDGDALELVGRNEIHDSVRQIFGPLGVGQQFRQRCAIELLVGGILDHGKDGDAGFVGAHIVERAPVQAVQHHAESQCLLSGRGRNFLQSSSGDLRRCRESRAQPDCIRHFRQVLPSSPSPDELLESATYLNKTDLKAQRRCVANLKSTAAEVLLT